MVILHVAGKPCPIQTSENEALVNFITDAQKEFTGFRLSYIAVSPDHGYVTEGRLIGSCHCFHCIVVRLVFLMTERCCRNFQRKIMS